jgi:hypothetical protein
MTKYGPRYRRVDMDRYLSPQWVVTEALAHYVDFVGKHIWEPACANGTMAEALKAAGAAFVHATDIDSSYAEQGRGLDFLQEDQHPDIAFDGIVTNCPYGKGGRTAERFIETGLRWIEKHGGFLALLLASDFDAGRTRRWFFADSPHFALKIILTERIVWFPRADGRRVSPMANHAWFVWRRDVLRVQRPPIIASAPRPAPATEASLC